MRADSLKLPDPAALLTTRQAAALLGVHPLSLARWRMAGTGPEYLALSRRAIRYSRSTIESWLQERTRLSTAA